MNSKKQEALCACGETVMVFPELDSNGDIDGPEKVQCEKCENKLKPCPFCGSLDVEFDGVFGCVCCMKCHCQGPVAADEGLSIGAWVKRT